MSENLLLIDIPNFNPNYKSDIYYSSENDKGKENLKNLLTDCSDGYCMYCYTKILIDNKNFGQLEHTIEKCNSNKLVNCLSNISIACPKCNLSFKKKGQAKRSLNRTEKLLFESKVSCKLRCITMCDGYRELRSVYLQKETASIILQPFGVKSDKSDNYYRIQYDLLSQKFIPSKNFNYNKDEISFINRHINRFNLNDARYRTKEIINLCEDVLEYKKIPKIKRYSNYIVDLFIEKLRNIDIDKAIGVCGIIHTQALMLHKTR